MLKAPTSSSLLRLTPSIAVSTGACDGGVIVGLLQPTSRSNSNCVLEPSGKIPSAVMLFIPAWLSPPGNAFTVMLLLVPEIVTIIHYASTSVKPLILQLIIPEMLQPSYVTTASIKVPLCSTPSKMIPQN